tara:strand:- start:773 stop:1114 length:342 start_codon:yes stop_codon:yes gene_type:complete
MTEQLDLTDWRQRQEQGMRLASENAGDAWKQYAASFLRHFLRQRRLFIVEDLWQAGLKEPASGGKRAVGAVIKEAFKAGLIKPKTDEEGNQSGRPSKSSNGSLMPLWVSQKYR